MFTTKYGNGNNNQTELLESGVLIFSRHFSLVIAERLILKKI